MEGWAGGGPSAVGVRARTGGDGQRGAQRPGALRPDPEVGVRIIRAAHEAGVRRLAMEALPHQRGEPQGPILAMPPGGRAT